MATISDHTLRAASLLQSNHPAAWLGDRGQVLDPQQQMERISVLDPLGFLIAVCKGEPILSYRLEPISKRYRASKPSGGKITGSRRVLRAEIAVEDGVRVLAEYWTPSIGDRLTAARVLYAHQLPTSQRPAASPAVDPDPAHTRMIQEALEQRDSQCSESQS